jgi:hypothetical protein
VRMRGEFFYSTIFIGNGSDIHTEQWATFPHSHPEDLGICHGAVSLHVCCHQHKIQGCVRGVTVIRPV